MKSNITSDNTTAFGGKKKNQKQTTKKQDSFSYPTSKSIYNEKQIRKEFSIQFISVKSENPNLPHNSISFFQVGTVSGQRSFLEKIIVANCQKDLFALDECKVSCSN